MRGNNVFSKPTALPPFSAHLALLPHGLLAQGLSPPKLLGGGLEFNVGLNEELLMTTASLLGLCILYKETLTCIAVICRVGVIGKGIKMQGRSFR